MIRSRFIARRLHILKSLKRAFQAESQQFFKRRRINELDSDNDDIDEFDVFNIEYDDDVSFHSAFNIFSVDELNVDNLNKKLQQYIIAKTDDFQKSIIEEFQNLQRLTNYQDAVQIEIIFFEKFDDDDISDESIVQTFSELAIMILSLKKSFSEFLIDEFVFVSHVRSIHIRSNFVIVMNL